jgi:ParB-like chromosome segregation protein Spo0J
MSIDTCENKSAADILAESASTEIPAEDQPLVIQPSIVLVPLGRIIVPDGRRSTDPSKIDSLAESLKESGLLQPIGVDAAYNLVYGAHRLAAVGSLGWPAIPAMILNLDELHSELAQIDENLVRSILSPLEQDCALARRKQIFELLHPETKQHVAGGKSSGASRRGEQGTSGNVSFVQDAAAKTGQSPRTVERKVAIGQNIDPEAAKLLKGSPIEKSQAELKALSELPVETQRQTAAKVKSGAIKSVRKAPIAIPNALHPDTAKSEVATNGLNALKILAQALTVCGQHNTFRITLEQIKNVLTRHAKSVAKPGTKDKPSQPVLPDSTETVNMDANNKPPVAGDIHVPSEDSKTDPQVNRDSAPLETVSTPVVNNDPTPPRSDESAPSPNQPLETEEAEWTG